MVFIDTVTGKDYHILVTNQTTIGQIKLAIWKQSGIPPFLQGLIFKGRELSREEESMFIGDCGISENSRLQLVLLTRSGPLSVRKTRRQPSSPEKRERECESREENDEEDRSKEDREREWLQRWEENRRTKQKMKEIQDNLERLRIERRNFGNRNSEKSLSWDKPCCSRTTSNGTTKSSASSTATRMSSPPPSASSTTGTTSFYGLLSAPEDTSAKESSAGETEYEVEWPIKASSYANNNFNQQHFGSRQYPLSIPTSTSEHFVAGRRDKATMPTRRVTHPFGLRVASSSSEPESSGALWTGSEWDDDVGLLTAEDEPIFSNNHNDANDHVVGNNDDDVDDDDDQEYFTGVEMGSGQEHSRLDDVVCCLDDPSDPSELSSGMLMITQLANDSRKVKVQRKKHAPKSTGNAKKPISNPPVSMSQPSKSIRARSKARSLGGAMGGGMYGQSGGSPLTWFPQNQLDPAVVSSGESSSCDERSANAKKFQMGGWRTSKRGGGHRLPYSSQSQQRCHACGCKLTFVSTFQCRCGKAYCSRHKNPVNHTCSAHMVGAGGGSDMTARDGKGSSLGTRTIMHKVPQVSD